MITIIITILATIYIMGLIVLFGGRYLTERDNVNNSPLTPLGDYLFIIFWPISIPFFIWKDE